MVLGTGVHKKYEKNPTRQDEILKWPAFAAPLKNVATQCFPRYRPARRDPGALVSASCFSWSQDLSWFSSLIRARREMIWSLSLIWSPSLICCTTTQGDIDDNNCPLTALRG